MAKSKGANLHSAKKAKMDEFYTQISDIEKELQHYIPHFKDKIVFCNCDDPEWSNFWKYFELNFSRFGLKKLISTHFETDKPSYRLELKRAEDGGDINNDNKINHLDIIRTPLKQNGDFRSQECIDILLEADIVVTNPPFSLFREYIAQLIEYEKKFLTIGNMNAITYKDTFGLIKDNKVWLGITAPKEFIKTDKTTQKFGNICWYTNLKHKKRNEELILYKEYNEKEYPKYDNYDAINVDKVKEIPVNYQGVMGVPITFLDHYNPKQFGMLDANDFIIGNKAPIKKYGLIKDKDGAINGKAVYARILIRKK
jgi:hypothetical protein